MDCIFNELSVSKVNTIERACQILEEFVNIAVALQKIGIVCIRLPEEFGDNLYSIELAKDYFVGSWLNDNNVDSAIRDSFRLIVTTTPFLTVQELLELFDRSIFKVANIDQESKGFGAAYLSQSLLISFLTGDVWDSHNLQGNHWYLDLRGQEYSEQIVVLHLSRLNHLGKHEAFIYKSKLQNLRSSKALWDERSKFFPNLILCGQVEHQLSKIGISKYLNQIFERLRSLDSYASNWTSGDSFNLSDLRQLSNIDVSTESKSTMDKYGHQRRFKISAGRYEYFELHIKMGSFRMHFYPDNVQKCIYVGYIGPHLDNVTG